MVPAPEPEIQIKLRVRCGDTFAFGPGKAALLEAIDACRSISGGGKALGLSYWKTRRLVDEMNQCFNGPLVETVRGGSQKGGATLTDTGREVLRVFRAMEARAGDAVQETWQALRPLLGKR
ncbi:winged helix-turn-helix domain-containing protein [Mesoterricola sediminis]|uniref:LysR family transcriptional regulator n=1 Tax=Mesoterricola sediminis TaxID=2927980 RepID=A0AA48HHL8_9BACT|nr:LysR family transcriptional regulator [Mesoterricola sediminis]BDU78378.1 LysR family transcriptional regulator [Mesoterricola sediminis]